MLFVEFVLLCLRDRLLRVRAETKGLSAIPAVLSLFVFVIFLAGFFVVDPNRSRCSCCSGPTGARCASPGFYWTNPFTRKKAVSLRAHNLNGQKLKVNDLIGNPIEIAAVVVWQVRDTARPRSTSRTSRSSSRSRASRRVRLLASRHPYDDDHTTRRDVAARQRGRRRAGAQRADPERLDRAGVEVIEARLSHLAYAPEIASAMLQRQQAGAIIAARTQIVDGAVGMVEMALEKLCREQGRRARRRAEGRARRQPARGPLRPHGALAGR